MNPPSEDIKDLLDSSSLFTFGTDLFIGEMPDGPDVCVCIFDTGGAGRNAKRVDDLATVMIHVRGTKHDGYQTSYANVESIRDELHAKNNETVNSTRYISIFAMSEPLFLEYDDEQRPLWSINFSINRTA